MLNKILFIFEGEKTEVQIASLIENHFFDRSKMIIKSIYGAEIYQIYKELKKDPDLDIFNLVKERSPNNSILNPYKRADFAEVYLFFDYDGHSSLADDEKIKHLIQFFDQETENGKLYISYPMVEALKHIEHFDHFKDLQVNCKRNISYKNLVHGRCLIALRNINKYDFETWKKVVVCHLKKINFIVSGNFVLPSSLISQEDIFDNQFTKYINVSSQVAVSSAFPAFLHDYFGNTEMQRKLSNTF